MNGEKSDEEMNDLRTYMCIGRGTADLSGEKPMNNVLTLLPHS